MLTDPIRVGEKYRTRSGVEVKITSYTKWNSPSHGSSGPVFYPWQDSSQCTYSDGPYVGKSNPNVDYPWDLVERLSSIVFEPQQLDLFEI